MLSRQVVLQSRPHGMPKQSDFAVESVTLDAPAEGEIQVRNVCMSVDPYMRGRMVDRKSYVPPFQIGEVLTGGAIGEVVASNASGFAPGDMVRHNYGWREGLNLNAEEAEQLGTLAAPASAYLGVIGMPGMTSYVGLLEVGALKDGENPYSCPVPQELSAAFVGQIAKLKGCTVLGSAGTADKVSWLPDELGFDYAFDYHDGRILNHLREGAPEGIDVYFDNVGGDHLEATLFHMRQVRSRSTLRCYFPLQRHRAPPRTQQSGRRNRPGADVERLHRVALQPPGGPVSQRHGGLGAERRGQVSRNRFRRHRAGGRCVHRFVHWRQRGQDDRQSRRLTVTPLPCVLTRCSIRGPFTN